MLELLRSKKNNFRTSKIGTSSINIVKNLFVMHTEPMQFERFMKPTNKGYVIANCREWKCRVLVVPQPFIDLKIVTQN